MEEIIAYITMHDESSDMMGVLIHIDDSGTAFV